MKKKILISLLFSLTLTVLLHGHDMNDTVAVAETGKKSFNAEEATTEYLNILTPEQKERSDAYFEGGYRLMLVEFIVQLFIAWVFLYLGLSKWLKKITSGVRRQNIRNMLYIMMYLLLAYVISFPLNLYTGFIREHHYGLSNMSFGEWLSEDMISLLLMVAFGSVLLMCLYIAMRKVKEKWWLWGSGGLIVFLIISLILSPVFIAPLFNKYTPLEDGPVKEEILSLARANGVPVDNVYQFNASKQSTRISANVSGMGKTIRISLNDNLLNNCSLPEIKAVMAHEMGHYVLNHVYKLFIYLSIVLVIGMAVADMLMRLAIRKAGARWQIDSISDIGTLPLFVLVFSFFMLIASPVINNVVRTTEAEADIFGLNAAREPDGFASIAMKLSDYRKIEPGHLEEIIFFDHPSGRSRVSMAMRWKAENNACD